MTAAAWWAVGLAAIVVLAGCLVGPGRRSRDAHRCRRQAARRAEALLLRWLSPAQRAQYRRRGWFEVVTPAGYRYRIWPQRVMRLDCGRFSRRFAYCIEARSAVPVADELPAKKLLLETDEARFLATAHHYRYR
jgi:hypothetical protein